MRGQAAGLIVAGGRGARLGGEAPKQFQDLNGKPVLAWSIEAFAAAGVETVVVVVPPGFEDRARALAPGAIVVAGGAERTDSVRRGLEALTPRLPATVLIHDAARPGLTASMIERLIAALADADACAPAAPGSDSVRTVDRDGWLIACPPREGLVRVQTPQAFRFDALIAAYTAWGSDRVATDDLEIAHAAGLRARLIPGELRLHKLTFAEDFALLEALMADRRMESRTGFGVDAHRFGPGAHVTLCGVEIAHTNGLVGHSDADAGWHALTDAILGALSAGDIGDHFPPSDPQWKGAPSRVFLKHAADLVAKAGGRIVHVDVTLICERPKIKPHREAMRAATAALLDLAIDRVSVKATTTEEMGFTGRSEGLASQAVATIEVPVR